MGRTVNQTELAEIFGKSDVTIWEWQKDGLPMISQGSAGLANQYDSEACIAWYVAREIAKAGKNDPRDQLNRLLVREKELDLAEREKILVPVDQVEPLWQQRVFAAAAFLLGQPSRLAGMLEGAVGLEAKREILKTEFTEFLNKLGVDGPRMQEDVQHFMERLSASDAAELLSRFTKGHEPKPDAARSAQPGVGPPHAGPADPAVGVG
jgi:phage terminase Nu1 subunit (DNA packaging protein)